MGAPHRLIRSGSRPSVVITDFNPKLTPPGIASPQMRPASGNAPIERHSPPAWAPATAFAESSEFAQMPTLTANPVHRSPMASVRRLFGRPDEESIVITLPQPTSPPTKTNSQPAPQPAPQQAVTTTEAPNTRDMLRSKLFSQSTRKPSRRLIFKYLG